YLYISKDVIFQKNLHLADSLILTTTHNLKVLLNVTCKAAVMISSVTSDLLTAACQDQEIAVISDSLIDDLFIDEKIQSK
ncbi:hypothetical protein BDFG_02408, partial [Blastomyces dermatitidis ATCC 26199]